MLNAYAWLQTKLYTLGETARDENGSQLVEKAGVVGLVAVLMAAVITAMQGRAPGIGELVANIIQNWISQLGLA
jgi:Flp pilus assembly pilin Flp